MICTPNLCNKKMWVTVLVQMLKIILPLDLVNLLKNKCAHAYSPDYVIFMRSTVYAVQY